MSSETGDWVSVRVKVSAGEQHDAALAALFASGSQGVQELADGFLTHVEGSDNANALLRAVMTAAPEAVVHTEPLPRVDWSEQWKAGIRAQELGRIVIAPPWLAREYEPERIVTIEPGMAFGTGDHATTRGVIRLMQRVIREGDSVADLGAGSAVLSIAATRLGASHAAAIELDPDAIGNAIENVKRNGVEDRVVVIEGDASLLLPLVAPVQLVLANIISSVLQPMLPRIAGALAPNGHAILSGILGSEEAGMREALARAGLAVLDEDREDIWWSFTVART